MVVAEVEGEAELDVEEVLTVTSSFVPPSSEGDADPDPQPEAISSRAAV